MHVVIITYYYNSEHFVMCIVFFCVNGYEKDSVNDFHCSDSSAMKLTDVPCLLQDNQCWELQRSLMGNSANKLSPMIKDMHQLFRMGTECESLEPFHII